MNLERGRAEGHPATVRSMMWQVVLHSDDVNTCPAVLYALRSGCGMTSETALATARTVNGDGAAVVGQVADRDGAEAVVAALQVLGLHVTIHGG